MRCRRTIFPIEPKELAEQQPFTVPQSSKLFSRRAVLVDGKLAISQTYMSESRNTRHAIENKKASLRLVLDNHIYVSRVSSKYSFAELLKLYSTKTDRIILLLIFGYGLQLLHQRSLCLIETSELSSFYQILDSVVVTSAENISTINLLHSNCFGCCSDKHPYSRPGIPFGDKYFENKLFWLEEILMDLTLPGQMMQDVLLFHRIIQQYYCSLFDLSLPVVNSSLTIDKLIDFLMNSVLEIPNFGPQFLKEIANGIIQTLLTRFLFDGFGTQTHRWKFFDDSEGDFSIDIAPFSFAKHMLSKTAESIASEPSMITLNDENVFIVGDIHGNYFDLMRVLNDIRLFSYSESCAPPFQLLFLGNYCDRGPHSVECVLMLSSLKTVFPNNIFLLRGNHEDRSITGSLKTYQKTSLIYQCCRCFPFGDIERMRKFSEIYRNVSDTRVVPERFKRDIQRLHGLVIWDVFSSFFEALPFCACVGELFCTHGGLPRRIGNPFANERLFSEWNEISRPLPDPTSDVDTRDFLWSDVIYKPIKPDCPFTLSERSSIIICMNSNSVHRLNQISKGKFTMVVRGHEPQDNGVTFNHDQTIMSLWSTSQYGDRCTRAGYALIEKNAIRTFSLPHMYNKKESIILRD